MSQSEGGRTKRVALLKKLIIAFLIVGVLIPIVLCILLFIKVDQLQRQVNELSAKQQEKIQTSVVDVEETADLPDEMQQIKLPEQIPDRTTDFSAFSLGDINSLPQPSHLSLKSIPVRKTIKRLLPHGWFFFITSMSPTLISIPNLRKF